MDAAAELQQQLHQEGNPHGVEQQHEDAAAQAAKAAANKTQERQMQINRVTTAYRLVACRAGHTPPG